MFSERIRHLRDPVDSVDIRKEGIVALLEIYLRHQQESHSKAYGKAEYLYYVPTKVGRKKLHHGVILFGVCLQSGRRIG